LNLSAFGTANKPTSINQTASEDKKKEAEENKPRTTSTMAGGMLGQSGASLSSGAPTSNLFGGSGN